MKLSPPDYILIKEAGSNKGHAKVLNFSNLSVVMSNGGEAVISGAGAATNFLLSNSNGVSFGTNGSTVTASVKTDYAGTAGAITGGSITVNTAGVSVNLPAYLTTAARSQDSSNYAGINGAITGGSITVNTSGVSVNLPAYLTTAAKSQDSSNYAGVNGAITGGSITVNTSGVSVNLPAYLTTAALSQDSSKYAGINGAITGGSITVNTSGVSVNLPAYLTTAALSQDSSKYAGTNSGATNCSVTVNTSGVSVSVGPDVTVSAWPDVLPASTAVSTYYSGSTSQGAGGNSTQTGYTFSLYAVPLQLHAAVAFSEARLGISNNVAAGTGSVTHVYSMGFYTNNASTLSLVKAFYGGVFYSQNSVTSATFSIFTVSTGGATAGGNGGWAGLAASSIFSRAAANMSSDSQYFGRLQFMRLGSGAATTLTGGQYYCVFGNCSVSSGANCYSNVGFLQSNAIQSLNVPDLGRENSTQTSNYLPAWGAISTTFTSASNTASWFPMPNAIAITNMSLSSSAWLRFHFPVLRNHS